MVSTSKGSKTHQGFTIVELLIVIVVIGILAAISIITYAGIQDKAHDNIVRQDLSTIANKLEMTKAELGRYPESTAEMPEAKLSKGSYDLKQNNVYFCLDKAHQAYSFGVRSKTGKGYFLTSNGLKENVSVNGLATCTEIGKAWTNDDTTYVTQGYSSSTGIWNTGWLWTN